MEKKKYFERPKQVQFFDEENSIKHGIAYKDEIICACCGGVYTIEEIYKYNKEENPIQPYDYWIDFTEQIM